MKKLSLKEKMQIVMMYEVPKFGIPNLYLKPMCRKAQISYPKLCNDLYGQTGRMHGALLFTYTGDVLRFVEGLPVID